MVDPMLSVWDAAAVQPIIEEAGGRFTDWAGKPSIHTGNALATNGKLHDDIAQPAKKLSRAPESILKNANNQSEKLERKKAAESNLRHSLRPLFFSFKL